MELHFTVRYSGYCCWRGLSSSEVLKQLPLGMYKTVISPSPHQRVSFTCGTMKDKRRFWALDIMGPAATPIAEKSLKAYLLEHLQGFDPTFSLIVEETQNCDILQTDVYDSVPWPPHHSKGRVVLIGTITAQRGKSFIVH